jgi:hypothetical protein
MWDLGTVANILQIVTSITFFVAALSWARDKMKKHGALTTMIIVLLSASIIVSGISLAERFGWFSGMEVVKDRHFDNETVVLDGHAFYNCIFERVKFQYGGGSVFIAPDTKFIGQGDFMVTNPTAANVVRLMVQVGVLKIQPQAGVQLLPLPGK